MSADFRSNLAVSGGSAIMVALFGEHTWAFLLCVGLVLTVLAYSSWRVRWWAWQMTLVVYGIGVLGSLWQVSVGIPQGWVAGSGERGCVGIRRHARCAAGIHAVVTHGRQRVVWG